MARRRVVLQPPIRLTASAEQRPEDAARVGDDTRVVVFCTVYEAPTSGTVTINLQTIANVEDEDAAGTAWITAGTITYTTTPTSKRVILYYLGDAIRWKLTSPGSPTTFGLTAFFSDQGDP